MTGWGQGKALVSQIDDREPKTRVIKRCPPGSALAESYNQGQYQELKHGKRTFQNGVSTAASKPFLKCNFLCVCVTMCVRLHRISVTANVFSIKFKFLLSWSLKSDISQAKELTTIWFSAFKTYFSSLAYFHFIWNVERQIHRKRDSWGEISYIVIHSPRVHSNEDWARTSKNQIPFGSPMWVGHILLPQGAQQRKQKKLYNRDFNQAQYVDYVHLKLWHWLWQKSALSHALPRRLRFFAVSFFINLSSHQALLDFPRIILLICAILWSEYIDLNIYLFV